MTAPASGVPTQLGHIALRVRDVDRAVAFYSDVLGLKVKQRMGQMAFLGIRPDASHEIALFPLPADAPGPEAGRVGMYHMAWEMASFEELAALNDRLKAKGANIVGYSDRQCNVMFTDPDGNELEAIWEPPAEEWERLKNSPGGVPQLPR
jgi:catechol-2,3-dioxygenase